MISKKRGFTLLEMLLVIAIIAILAAIVIVAINPSRQLAQARNAQRASDLNAIHKAIQQYYIDELKYPWQESGYDDLTYEVPDDTAAYEICGTSTGDDGACVDLEDYLVPTYLSALPTNPAGGNYVMALDNGSQISMGAPGSNDQDLAPVFIGSNTYVEEAAGSDGGGDTDPCADLEGDDRRYCDLEEINDAILAYIDDNGHAPYLADVGCGPMENGWDELCNSCEPPSNEGEGCYPWSVLAAELSDYISPLPTDPCGEACLFDKGFSTYYYAAPQALAFFCSLNGCYSNESYGLHAENLEDSPGSGISYGFGSW